MEKDLIGPQEESTTSASVIPSSYILECTAKPYDGIDAHFDTVIKSFPYHNVVPIIDQAVKIPLVYPLNPGQPLFHICSLSIQLITLYLKFSENTIEHLNTLLPYVIKWVDLQVEKLANRDPNNLSEFHWSQKMNKTMDDYKFVQYISEKLKELLMCIVFKHPGHHLAAHLSDSLTLLEKNLRKAFKNDPVLSMKKHINLHFDTLNVMKFENYICKVLILVYQEKFDLAECHANKSLYALSKLTNFDKQTLKIVITTALAYIASKNNDIELVLSYLDKAFKLVSISAEGTFAASHVFYLSEVCEYAGAYFEKTGEIDKSIKYYQEAFNYSNHKAGKSKNKNKLSELSRPLVKQLATYFEGEKFSGLLETVKCYVDHLRLDLYFISVKYVTLFNAILAKNKIDTSGIKNQPNAVAITINYEFNVDIFKATLVRVKTQQEKDKAAELNELKKCNIKRKPDITEESKQKDSSRNMRLEGASGSHPKASKTKPKKPKPVEMPVITVPRWEFLDERRPKPLEKVEFLKAKKVFDPENRNGVVTLSVNGMTGRWFACMNPHIREQVEIIKKDEGLKLAAKFNTYSVLANDLCVPCYKEMETKSKELGVKLPYVFKIRLLGGEGLGNVRVYAEVIDQAADGKKLVAFTAINPNSHAKHTRPIHFDMPEERAELLGFTSLNN